MRLFTLDFEASCLPSYGQSFPIEVGVCDVLTGEVEAWLIRPHEAWRDWDWDPGAERIHGISRASLDGGLSVREILGKLDALGPDATVVSDSGVDRVWLETLAEAAKGSSPFEIADLDEVLRGIGVASPAEVEAAQAVALKRFPVTHRAGPDARRLAEMIRILQQTA